MFMTLYFLNDVSQLDTDLSSVCIRIKKSPKPTVKVVYCSAKRYSTAFPNKIGVRVKVCKRFFYHFLIVSCLHTNLVAES